MRAVRFMVDHRRARHQPAAVPAPRQAVVLIGWNIPVGTDGSGGGLEYPSPPVQTGRDTTWAGGPVGTQAVGQSLNALAQSHVLTATGTAAQGRARQREMWHPEIRQSAPAAPTAPA